MIQLRIRLALAAAVLGASAIAAAGTLYFGMQAVASRLDAAVVAERRMARYATLSTRVSTLLVIATEAVQTGRPVDARLSRLAPVASNISETFVRLHADLEHAVAEAQALGIDQQSRLGTQSLGLARMQALQQRLMEELAVETASQVRLKASIDSFASSFDPLLNQAVNAETVFRGQALQSIEDLRTRLNWAALVLAAGSLVLAFGGYWGLVRPQFSRLTLLRDAARRIGAADFSASLPDTQADEIGEIYRETNRMALALAAQRDQVSAEWSRLNEVIAERTVALRSANARLEEVDANRRRFFADVSHELRTPLTVILMEAQIGRQASAGQPEEASFGTIEARATRLNRRIDDLLRVARSDSGRLELEAIAEPVPRLAEQVQEEVRAEIANAGMDLAVGEPPDVDVLCDPNWLRQVLVSLIRNAIRHAREGGQLAFYIEAQGDDVRFILRDNGPGIPPDQHQRLFERFARSSASKAQGFGIGLALARWVVEEQGGRISLVSPVDPPHALGPAPGTELRVVLKRAPKER